MGSQIFLSLAFFLNEVTVCPPPTSPLPSPPPKATWSPPLLDHMGKLAQELSSS